MNDATVTVEFKDCTPPEVVQSPKGPREVYTRIRAVSSEGKTLLQVGADHYLDDVERTQWTAKILSEVEKITGGEKRRV